MIHRAVVSVTQPLLFSKLKWHRGGSCRSWKNETPPSGGQSAKSRQGCLLDVAQAFQTDGQINIESPLPLADCVPVGCAGAAQG